jgi:mono/diheme cytochrome c family protein
MSRSQASLVAPVVLALVSMAPVAQADPDAATIEAGATIYGNYCSSCHGEQLRNTSGGVTFDLRRLRREDRERFVTVVLNGKNQMPPWRGALDMKQIEAIWAYVRATVDR